MTTFDPDDPRTWPVELSDDPNEVTVVSQAPGLFAQRLGPKADDSEPIPEGRWATTPNGYRFQRRDGYFYTRSNWTAEELADADSYYERPYTRAEVEAEYGPLTPEEAEPMTYPHDDERCRQDSVDAEGFREACRQIARLAAALGYSDAGSFGEVVDLAITRVIPPGEPDA